MILTILKILPNVSNTPQPSLCRGLFYCALTWFFFMINLIWVGLLHTAYVEVLCRLGLSYYSDECEGNLIQRRFGDFLMSYLC